MIDCLERFGDRIDWAMVILNPLEPWPGELVLPAAERHGVKLITRVVDYGGLFHDDVLAGPRVPPRTTIAASGRTGWIEAGRARLERMRPIAERHGLTPLQLACQWNLAHAPVEVVAPTLIEEPHGAKPIEAKRAELAAVPRTVVLSEAEVAEIRAIGDNTGSMALKGAAPDFEGEPGPTAGRSAPSSRRWPAAGASNRHVTDQRVRPRPGSIPGPMIRLPAIGAAAFALAGTGRPRPRHGHATWRRLPEHRRPRPTPRPADQLVRRRADQRRHRARRGAAPFKVDVRRRPARSFAGWDALQDVAVIVSAGAPARRARSARAGTASWPLPPWAHARRRVAAQGVREDLAQARQARPGARRTTRHKARRR